MDALHVVVFRGLCVLMFENNKRISIKFGIRGVHRIFLGEFYAVVYLSSST